jgi:secondary thiamine-phosphate synthase enzyme
MIRRRIELKPRPRGFHLVTDEIVSALPELEEVEVGLLHLMIRHTSAALTVNENASPDVRQDMRSWIDEAVPERFGWTHTLEGADDMPAHAKGTITGFDLTLPITGGRLDLGTWQGIYLGEYRDHGGVRTLTATILA